MSAAAPKSESPARLSAVQGILLFCGLVGCGFATEGAWLGARPDLGIMALLLTPIVVLLGRSLAAQPAPLRHTCGLHYLAFPALLFPSTTTALLDYFEIGTPRHNAALVAVCLTGPIALSLLLGSFGAKASAAIRLSLVGWLLGLSMVGIAPWWLLLLLAIAAMGVFHPRLDSVPDGQPSAMASLGQYALVNVLALTGVGLLLVGYFLRVFSGDGAGDALGGSALMVPDLGGTADRFWTAIGLQFTAPMAGLCLFPAAVFFWPQRPTGRWTWGCAALALLAAASIGRQTVPEQGLIALIPASLLLLSATAAFAGDARRLRLPGAVTVAGATALVMAGIFAPIPPGIANAFQGVFAHGTALLFVGLLVYFFGLRPFRNRAVQAPSTP